MTNYNVVKSLLLEIIHSFIIWNDKKLSTERKDVLDQIGSHKTTSTG